MGLRCGTDKVRTSQTSSASVSKCTPFFFKSRTQIGIRKLASTAPCGRAQGCRRARRLPLRHATDRVAVDMCAESEVIIIPAHNTLSIPASQRPIRNAVSPSVLHLVPGAMS